MAWVFSTTAMHSSHKTVLLLTAWIAHLEADYITVLCLNWTSVLDLGFAIQWLCVSSLFFLQAMAQGMCGGAALLQTRWLRGTCTCRLCMCRALDCFAPCSEELDNYVLLSPITECTEHCSPQPWGHQCEEGGLKWFCCLSPGEQEGVQVRSVLNSPFLNCRTYHSGQKLHLLMDIPYGRPLGNLVWLFHCMHCKHLNILCNTH